MKILKIGEETGYIDSIDLEIDVDVNDSSYRFRKYRNHAQEPAVDNSYNCVKNPQKTEIQENKAKVFCIGDKELGINFQPI